MYVYIYTYIHIAVYIYYTSCQRSVQPEKVSLEVSVGEIVVKFPVRPKALTIMSFHYDFRMLD